MPQHEIRPPQPTRALPGRCSDATGNLLRDLADEDRSVQAAALEIVTLLHDWGPLDKKTLEWLLVCRPDGVYADPNTTPDGVYFGEVDIEMACAEAAADAAERFFGGSAP
jgi:hypothetical protein